MRLVIQGKAEGKRKTRTTINFGYGEHKGQTETTLYHIAEGREGWRKMSTLSATVMTDNADG